MWRAGQVILVHRLQGSLCVWIHSVHSTPWFLRMSEIGKFRPETPEWQTRLRLISRTGFNSPSCWPQPGFHWWWSGNKVILLRSTWLQEHADKWQGHRRQPHVSGEAQGSAGREWEACRCQSRLGCCGPLLGNHDLDFCLGNSSDQIIRS